ncbi:MAG TPA: hypothetical protein VHE32_02960 [Rhodanobacteraceae bacterium]|jgi:hypothetical protein|nr:hypothetical protein [Rhodanobacteraceae bacterium]
MAYGEAYDTLYQFGLTSHTATAVGSAGRYGGQPIANLSGLSFTPDGDALYAVAGGMNSLARINPETGSASIVGLFGLAGQGDPHRNDALDLGMTFGCDGTLWLVSAYAEKVWTVDSGNGATELVGATGHTITGLVANGSVLYAAGGRGDNGFYWIDTSTGKATRIGDFGDDRWINSVSMSFDEAGKLWAVLNYVPPAPGSTTVPDWADLATIDVATGKLTIVGPITGPESLRQLGMKGFAIGPPRCALGGGGPFAAPVGTPPWLLVLAGLLVATAAVALRRRPLR